MGRTVPGLVIIMSVEQVKLKLLEQYPEESITRDELFLSKLREQLKMCEAKLAEINERHDNMREVVLLAPKSSINISAALEWKEVKEETVKLNGKSIKLHREISELSSKIKRRKELRAWAAT